MRIPSLLIAITIIIAGISADIVITKAEDVIISGNVTWENEYKELDGSLIITSGSSLTLRNTTVVMNLASDGEYNITIQAGGALYIQSNSTIRSNSTYTYNIIVEPGGTLYVANSTLLNIGPGTSTSPYAGFIFNGNSSNPIAVSITDSEIITTGFYAEHTNLTIRATKITHTGGYNYYMRLFQIYEGSNITVDNVNVTTGETPASFIVKAVPPPAGSYWQKSSRITIINTNITGLYNKIIYASGYSVKDLTINIVNSTIKNNYVLTSTSEWYVYLHGDNVLLNVSGSTIEVPDAKRPMILIHDNNKLEINNSYLAAGDSPIIHFKMKTNTNTKGYVRVENSVLDGGLSIIQDRAVDINKLFIYNVSNSNGKKLLFLKNQNSEYNVPNNIFQLIAVNSYGKIKVNNLVLNESIQPIIAFNSSIKLEDSKIEVNYSDNSGVDFYPRAIIGINNSEIEVINSTITSIVPVLDSGVVVNVINGGKLTINSSIIKAMRGNVIKATKEAPEYYPDITINSSIIMVESYKIIWSYVINYVTPPPHLTVWNTTFEPLPGKDGKGRFQIAGNASIDKCNINIYPTMYSTSITWATLIKPMYPGLNLTVTRSNITLRGTTESLLDADLQNVNAQIYNNNITIVPASGMSVSLIRTAGYFHVNGKVNLSSNTINGPGESYKAELAYISTSLDQGAVIIQNNNITGIPLGIFIDDQVASPNKIFIDNNNFTDMGGIFFEPGSEARQQISANNYVSGELIKYVYGANGSIVEGEGSEGFSEIIIVNSVNLSIKDIILSENAVTAIQVLNSSNITFENITADIINKGAEAVVLYNSSNILFNESNITSLPFTYLWKRGMFVSKDVHNLTINATRIVLPQTAYSGISVLYLENVKESSIVSSILNASSYNYLYIIKATYDTQINISESVIEGKHSYTTGLYIYRSFVNITGGNITTYRNGVYSVESSIRMANVTISDANTGIYVSNTQVNLIGLKVLQSSTYSINLGNSKWGIINGSIVDGPILVSSCNKMYIINTNISSSKSGTYALKIYNSKHVVVRDSNITSTVYGAVRVESSNNVTVVNSNIRDSVNEGIYLYNSDIVLLNTAISNNSKEGIKVAGSSVVNGYSLDILSNGNSEDPYHGVYVTSGSVSIHYSSIKGNYWLGAYATVDINMSNNYWGSDTGPQLIENLEEADNIDPEEILDPGNDTLNGNKVIYQPYLVSEPGNDGNIPDGWISYPDNRSTIWGLVHLEINGTDDTGIPLAIVTVDNRVEAVLYGVNTTVDWDTTEVPDGWHTVKLYVFDVYGNLKVEKYLYKVSNIHPYTEILSPKGNYTWARGNYPVTVYSSDNNPDTLKVYINGTLKYTWSGDNAVGQITYYVPTRDYPNGSVLLVNFTLTDLDGFSSSSIVYLKVDNEPPYITSQEPANNTYVPEVFEIKFETGDNQAFNNVSLKLNESTIYSSTQSGQHSVDINSTQYGYRDGDIIEAEIVSTDVAGNIETSVIFLTLDTVPPSITIISPENNTEVSGIVWINATVEDNNIVERVEIYINDTLVHYEEPGTQSAEISYQWNTTKYDPGTYIIKVIAYDSAGNSDGKINVNQVVPTPVPENGLIISMLTALLIFMVIWRKHL